VYIMIPCRAVTGLKGSNVHYDTLSSYYWSKEEYLYIMIPCRAITGLKGSNVHYNTLSRHYWSKVE